MKEKDYSDRRRIVQEGEILSPEEEDDLLKAYKEGVISKNEVVKHYYRFIYYVIQKYYKEFMSTTEEDDLFQEGVLGFLEGIDKYDPDKGRFMTYIAFWIRKNVREYISGMDIVKIPKQIGVRIKVFYKEYENMLESHPNNIYEYLKEFCDNNRYEYRNMLSAIQVQIMTSLDVVIDVEGNTTLYDLIPDKRDLIYDFISKEEDRDIKSSVSKGLQSLSEAERDAVIAFMENNKKLTRGVTRQARSDAKKRGIRKMRSYMEENGYV